MLVWCGFFWHGHTQKIAMAPLENLQFILENPWEKRVCASHQNVNVSNNFLLIQVGICCLWIPCQLNRIINPKPQIPTIHSSYQSAVYNLVLTPTCTDLYLSFPTSGETNASSSTTLIDDKSGVFWNRAEHIPDFHTVCKEHHTTYQFFQVFKEFLQLWLFAFFFLRREQG